MDPHTSATENDDWSFVGGLDRTGGAYRSRQFRCVPCAKGVVWGGCDYANAVLPLLAFYPGAEILPFEQ
jgi:hypothetical protein